MVRNVDFEAWKDAGMIINRYRPVVTHRKLMKMVEADNFDTDTVKAVLKALINASMPVSTEEIEVITRIEAEHSINTESAMLDSLPSQGLKPVSNFKYLVTYGKLLYDKNDFLPFLVETTAPISTAFHFTVLKNRVVSPHTDRPDDYIPISVSLLLPGAVQVDPAEFSVVSVESVHPTIKSK